MVESSADSFYLPARWPGLVSMSLAMAMRTIERLFVVWVVLLLVVVLVSGCGEGDSNVGEAEISTATSGLSSAAVVDDPGAPSVSEEVSGESGGGEESVDAGAVSQSAQGLVDDSSSLGFDGSVRAGGLGGDAGQFVAKAPQVDDGSESVLFDESSEPVFWGALGLRIERTSAVLVDGDPALKIEFEAQNAVEQSREYQIGLFNVALTGASSAFPIIGVVDHAGASGSALLFPSAGTMGVELFVATPELLSEADGLRLLVGTAFEIGVEIPLDGQANRLPDYPVRLDVGQMSPPDLTPTTYLPVATCGTDFKVDVRDVSVDVVYPARFTVVPAGTRTLNVSVNFSPVGEMSGPCPMLVRALKSFPLTIETDLGPGELVLADAVEQGYSDEVGSVGFIGIYEIEHRATEISVGFDELGYVSAAQAVELGHFLNEKPTFGTLDPTGAGGELNDEQPDA